MLAFASDEDQSKKRNILVILDSLVHNIKITRSCITCNVTKSNIVLGYNDTRKKPFPKMTREMVIKHGIKAYDLIITICHW